MPKGRMLNKKISVNRTLPNLSVHAALLFTWCIPHLDVEGKMYADPQQIKGIVVPYLKYFTIKRIEFCLKELNESGIVVVYGDGYKYMKFIGFANEQSLNPDRETPSQIPDPAPDLLKNNSGETPAKDKIKLSKGKDKVGVSPITMSNFELVWNLYPNRQGRKQAEKHFFATVKTDRDYQNIQTALGNYLISGNVQSGFIKLGSTWFNDWESWVSPTEQMMRGSTGQNNDQKPKQPKNITREYAEPPK